MINETKQLSYIDNQLQLCFYFYLFPGYKIYRKIF